MPDAAYVREVWGLVAALAAASVPQAALTTSRAEAVAHDTDEVVVRSAGWAVYVEAADEASARAVAGRWDRPIDVRAVSKLAPSGLAAPVPVPDGVARPTPPRAP